ncbi:hypothetical protein ACWDBW_09805 [Streptomyces sp. NPDC001107]
MDAAWVGTLGALGGALLGALGTYFAPLRVERNRIAHLDDQNRKSEMTSALGRAADLRVTSALWLECLSNTIQDLEHGHNVTLDIFTARVEEHTSKARTAVSQTLRDEVHISSMDLRPYRAFLEESESSINPAPDATISQPSPGPTPPGTAAPISSLDEETASSSAVSTFLREATEATRRIRKAILSATEQHLEVHTVVELERMVRRANQARSAMVESLLQSITERFGISLRNI